MSAENPENIPASGNSQSRPVENRLERWRQMLLDLSLRNRLLNTPSDLKHFLPVNCADICRMEDTLAAGKKMTLRPLEEMFAQEDGKAWRENTLPPEKFREVCARAQDKKILCVPLAEKELRRRTQEIIRQVRSDIEEGGVNTLFLAVGFLRWPGKEKEYCAPLVLLPVTLARSSILSQVTVERIDDEPQANVTLLEMLRRDFKLSIQEIDPLPTDERGVDIAKTVDIFRRAVADMPGFTVEESARLGIFSFSKFIMWNDLAKRSDALCANALVGHLLAGGGTYDDGIVVFPPEKIEDNIELGDLYCPLSADASQLTAVRYAALGKSFVLHGPPGTGKSQTITNIIVDSLARGRRVLFVAEKKAALDVVHQRLSRVGMQPFCLELHSRKACKSEVLRQFSEALNHAESARPAEWENTVRKLEEHRQALRGYVSALHRKYPNGFSAYHCQAKLTGHSREEIRNWEKMLEMDCLRQSADVLTESRLLLNETVAAFKYVSAEARESLDFLGVFPYSAEQEEKLRSLAEKAAAAATALRDAVAVVLADDKDGMLVSQEMARALGEIANQKDMPAPGLLRRDYQEKIPEWRKLIAAGRALAALSRGKLRGFACGALERLDCESIRARLDANAQRFFIARYFLDRALVKELAVIKSPGASALCIEDLRNALPHIEEFQKQWDILLASAEWGAAFGKSWQKENSDWDALDNAVNAAEKINALLEEAAGKLPPQSANGFWDKIPALLRQCALPGPAADLRTAVGDFSRVSAEFVSVARCDRGELPWGNSLEEFAVSARRAAAALRELRQMCLWKKQRAAAVAAGMAGLIAAMENGEIKDDEAAPTFVKAYYVRMVGQIMAVEPLLRDFMGVSQNEKIRAFREYDSGYLEMSRQIAIAKTAERLPSGLLDKVKRSSELGILQHELEKKTRHKPVRKLLEQIPTLAAGLKPCFLMSPLSVAQYLPPESRDFDLVIFDEASQIPAWDAIGAIARGKQLIVVGDQKQMPPTNFFQKNAGADDEEAAEDLESILDECMAAGMESSYLLWHYRSRHETLIDFSNRHYYNGNLFTFPAARNAGDLGVRHVLVKDGQYARGTRINRKEAEALVDYVWVRLQNPATAGKSVGIVTFSQAQKDLIEDLLEERRAANPEMERYFCDETAEPLFVKNLENVQGDERDVILFSVGYAPDAQGKFAMNFGPLNRQGGERRLNVAITRAKEQVVVFSSMPAAAIDLGRTAAAGAAHLREFLEYAERETARCGSAAPADKAVSAGRDGEEPFAAAVAGFLRDEGYEVLTGVGCSAFRIDVAVKALPDADTFVLGIECDGRAYCSGVTVRDREETRPAVLQGLGWELYRLWITDWWHDSETTKRKLLEAVREAVANAG